MNNNAQDLELSIAIKSLLSTPENKLQVRQSDTL